MADDALYEAAVKALAGRQSPELYELVNAAFTRYRDESEDVVVPLGGTTFRDQSGWPVNVLNAVVHRELDHADSAYVNLASAPQELTEALAEVARVDAAFLDALRSAVAEVLAESGLQVAVGAGDTDEQRASRRSSVDHDSPAADRERTGDGRLGGYGLTDPESEERDLSVAAQGEIAVSIYLGDGRDHEDVEIAVGRALTAAGLYITKRSQPRIGSWFAQWRAAMRRAAQTPVGAEVVMAAVHGIEQRAVLDKDADITEKLMRNLGPVIAALAVEERAVIRLGAVLAVKVDGQLTVHQLTTEQQLTLNHQPRLLMSPREVLEMLETDQASIPQLEPEEQRPAIGP